MIQPLLSPNLSLLNSDTDVKQSQQLVWYAKLVYCSCRSDFINPSLHSITATVLPLKSFVFWGTSDGVLRKFPATS
jgi:hypothetical protein